MDKNFVNIDDLVRQRLSGGEERERSGAWLRMRELLDEEESRKPVGFLYWRRLFGAVALLLLLTTISVGGYKLTTSGHNSPETLGTNTVAALTNTESPGSPIAASTVTEGSSAAVPETSVASADASVEKRSSSNTKGSAETIQNNTPVQAGVASQPHSIADVAGPALPGSSAKNGAHHHSAATHHSLDIKNAPSIANVSDPASKANDQNASDYYSVNNNPSGNHIHHSHSALHTLSSSPASAHLPGKVKDNSLAFSADNSQNSNNSEVNNPDNKNIGAVKSNPNNKNIASEKLSTTQKDKNNNGIVSNSNTPTKFVSSGGGDVNANESSAAENAAPESGAPAVAAKATKPATHRAASKPVNTKPNAGQAKMGNEDNTNASSLAKVKGTTSQKREHKTGKTINSVSTEKPSGISGNMKSSAHKTNSHPAAKTSADPLVLSSHASEKSAHAAAKKSADKLDELAKEEVTKKPEPAKIGKAGRNAAADAIAVKDHNSGSAGNSRGARTSSSGTPTAGITDPHQKGNAGNTGNITGNTASVALPKRDKTSLEKMIVYQRHMRSGVDPNHLDFDTISVTEFSKEVKDPDESSRMNSGNTTSGAGANPANSNSGANKQILPGASSSSIKSAGKSANSGSVKEMADDAPTGAQQLANLNQAFNDIKYKVGSARFTPGLSAGLNSTFFGPNSFKGFQFGITGNFIFGDNWGVMAELKYFHRVNNNYTLDDYYYQTTQGNKQLELTTYTFSQLQSFELPVAAQFKVGNFSFFAGLNIAYLLAINLNRDNPQATNAAAPVGTDNSPKLSVSDFNSKIALGYLFGVSYQIGTNVALDVRNVQNVWSNAGTTGGKIVSDQLYKSPSLQLSVLYRFGSKKDKK